MNDLCAYTIQLRGQVSESEINALVPLRLAAAESDVQAGTGATRFTLRSDQSGLIGLMRSLHGLGFIILSVNREELVKE